MRLRAFKFRFRHAILMFEIKNVAENRHEEPLQKTVLRFSVTPFRDVSP